MSGEWWGLVGELALIVSALVVVFVLNRVEAPDRLADTADRRRDYIRREREARWRE